MTSDALHASWSGVAAGPRPAAPPSVEHRSKREGFSCASTCTTIHEPLTAPDAQEDILMGCGGAAPLVEVDRAAAIARVIAEAAAGDTVLIAGKGHETYQEIAGDRIAFSDVQCANHYLAQRRAA